MSSKKKEGGVRVFGYVPTSLYRALEREAEERMVSQSSIIRLALAQHLGWKPEPNRNTGMVK